jgi:ribonuclease HII
MQTVIGIDEVGRGSWAGPLLVVAARQVTALPPGISDSKALTPARREALVEAIRVSCTIGEGWVSPAEIDELGLTGAMRLAVDRALMALNAAPHEAIIMDGHINYCADEFTNVTCVIKADALHPIVGAASIYAKVARDNYMTKIALQFPEYGFEKHVGYGTAAHLQALRTLGVCDLHRRSYKPIQQFV